MKNINKFFDHDSLFKIYLVMYLILALFITGLMYVLDYTIGHYSFSETINYFYFGFFVSIPFSFMFISMISMSRKTIIFWNYAKELEQLIDNVQTREQLLILGENNFNKLVDMCQGGSQIGEVKRIKAIIETRLKYWR